MSKKPQIKVAMSRIAGIVPPLYTMVRLVNAVSVTSTVGSARCEHYVGDRMNQKQVESLLESPRIEVVLIS